MPSDSRLIDDLAKSVTTTTSLLESLLGEIRNHSTSLAVLQDKLESISTNVNSLSAIVREGNGSPSVITRLALIEKELEDLAEQLDDHKGEVNNDFKKIENNLSEAKEKAVEFNRQKSLSMWKLLIAVSPGIIALIIQILSKLASL